jgi:hypothetical protein
MKRTMLEATPIMVVLAVLITFVLTAPSNSIGSTASQNANSATTQNSNRASSSDDLNMGTWKLNEAKSKIGAGAPKNHTVVYEAVGDEVKVTVDGVDGAGGATHSEWTGKFDGKYYAVTGDPSSDMRSYRRISKTTMTLTAKKGSKVTLTGRIVVTANGRSRTVTTTGVNSSGKKVRTTAVYDKQ